MNSDQLDAWCVYITIKQEQEIFGPKNGGICISYQHEVGTICRQQILIYGVFLGDHFNYFKRDFDYQYPYLYTRHKITNLHVKYFISVPSSFFQLHFYFPRLKKKKISQLRW